jgi:hypothetical protein
MKHSATHVPDEQTSPLPQLVPSGWFVTVQALVPLHVELASHPVAVQLIGVPPQTPAAQTSPYVQALPSLQVVPFVTLA